MGASGRAGFDRTGARFGGLKWGKTRCGAECMAGR